MALKAKAPSKTTPKKTGYRPPIKHSVASSSKAPPPHGHADTKNSKLKNKTTRPKGRVNDEDTKQNNKKNGSKYEKKPPKDGEVWSKSKKKRMRALRAKQTTAVDTTDHNKVGADPKHATSDRKASAASLAQPVMSAAVAGASKLQKQFHDRLSGSRFRILNEELYTIRSKDALQRFQANPTLFDEYHEGFRQQVSHWPVNPVSILVETIQQALETTPSLVVADFGCGDADLARQLLPVEVHSFDLVARGPNAELITACDIANTPLNNASVDIGVFCLSLMGTNLADFIREAHRVLKEDGVLHIAEVRSRFEDAKEEEESSLTPFLSTLNKLGFECTDLDRSNTMFVMMELRKNGTKPNLTLTYTAKPCIYKRR